MSRYARSVAFVLTALYFSSTARAQHDQHQAARDADTGWTWSVDSSVFLTANFQVRKFTDFDQVESQNWLMGAGRRKVGEGTLGLHSMLSFEPFTIRDLGSAQVFQTGESFKNAPLIDYQHPHDLFMQLAAAYERPAGGATVLLRGGLADEPALGPTAFMHRASSSLQPTAPLSHHELDSTHISYGVVTGGVRAGVWQIEASAFHGREPDENRTNLDLGALDSFSVRGSWIRGGTRAQVSVGHLNEPDTNEPGDVIKTTASLEHGGAIFGRESNITVAWGQNNELFDIENAYLFEGTLGLWRGGTGYVRVELADKLILGAGRHPPGFQHPHVISSIGALTFGYTHELLRFRQQTLAIGGDVTGYGTPAELLLPYGHPVSFHVFGHWTVGQGKHGH